MALRSNFSKSLQICEEFKCNLLPTNLDVIGHYFYLRKKLTVTSSQFLKKIPCFADVRDNLVDDVIEIWNRAGLPILSRQRIEAKLKNLISQFEAARKRAKRRKTDEVSEDWLKKLFDICKCKCSIEDCPKVRNKKLLCNCEYQDRISEMDICFIIDQRSERKMVISSVDVGYVASQKERANHLPKPLVEMSNALQMQPCSSGLKLHSDQNSALLTSSRLRKRSAATASATHDEHAEMGLEGRSENVDDGDYCAKEAVGGKYYQKVKKFSLSKESCFLADRRMTSLRQQSDILSTVIGHGIAASPSTVYRHREKSRIEALKDSETSLAGADSLQLCYDGKIVDKMDRYIFVGQFIDAKNTKMDEIVAVKSFSKEISVTAGTLFTTITDVCGGCLPVIYSVMSDTTALNTGRSSGVNKRLQDHMKSTIGHGIHELECMFHVNEVYLTHVITAVEGEKKGPGAMQGGALLNKLKKIEKPCIENLVPADQLQVPVSRMAALHLKAKLEWFSRQKSEGVKDHNLRSDQLCMLVLACYIVAEVPDNLKNLLAYKQETICHSRWVTTANGYLRMLIFNIGNLTNAQRTNLVKIVSFLLSVYVPSFVMIHLNPTAAEGPSLTLFQRDLILAYRKLEPCIADVVWKYFVQHASKWLSPKNVALSVYAKVPPFSLEAIRYSESFADAVDVVALLNDPKCRLKHFFTKESKEAPCISASLVKPEFWKSIDNHNRSTERRIGNLTKIINKKIYDQLSCMNRTDMRLRSYLCNIEQR